MSLISLLIALMAERYLSSPVWQFNHYYHLYIGWWEKINTKYDFPPNTVTAAAVVFIPTMLAYLLVNLIDDGLLHLILSTLILIVCFGCVQSRDAYKCYLRSAFRGEMTTCELNRQQLLQDKGIEEQGFGQALVWLNYRYYIAIMIFYVFFGAAGAVFYRLLTTLIEKNNGEKSAMSAAVYKNCRQVLAVIDWLPVRLTAFGYMFVGHFSKAFSTWLESLYDVQKSPNKVLISVAEVAEDYALNEGDCTAEPCLLVRLAKRNLLLIFAFISVLTLLGVID